MELYRSERRGKIVVDFVQQSEGTSLGTTNDIDVQSPYFVGGLDSRQVEQAANHLDVSCFYYYHNVSLLYNVLHLIHIAKRFLLFI